MKPDIQTQEVKYQAAGDTMTGYLAWDANQEGPRPGVIVVHEWWGNNEYVHRRARMLAEIGYIAFAIDMYGGKVAEHPADAQKFMEAVISNVDRVKNRLQAGYDVLKANDKTDPTQLAAIGYCFGGAMALHMARFGMDLKAVASFHGALGTETPAEKGAVKAKVLVLTGAEDPMVGPDAVKAFEEEMRAAGADFEVVSYPGAKHSFTNPEATARGEKYEMPLAYNEAADKDSWLRMRALFEEVFH